MQYSSGGATGLVSRVGVVNTKVTEYGSGTSGGGSSPTQYVASFSGDNSYISTGTANFPLVTGTPNSFFAWVNVGATQGVAAIFVYGGNGGNGPEAIAVNVISTSAKLDYPDGNDYVTATFPINSWHFVGFTYDGGTTVTLYLDGTPTTYTSIRQQDVGTISPFFSYIGGVGAPINTYYMQGYMSNVQFYNIALSPSQVSSIYAAGISGTPVVPANTIGWWPLNGDATDHSGNGNAGAATGVTYVTYASTPGGGGS